jgi:hypothetical protein
VAAIEEAHGTGLRRRILQSFDNVDEAADAMEKQYGDRVKAVADTYRQNTAEERAAFERSWLE